MATDPRALKELYPLNSMAELHRKLLAEHAESMTLARGEVLFREGDTDGSTYYLLEGTLSGTYADGRRRELTGSKGSHASAIGDLQPRRFTAVVSSKQARLVRFDRRLLEKALTLDQIVRGGQIDIGRSMDSARWVFRMLTSETLLKLPAGNVQRMFEKLEPVSVAPLQNVIEQGEEGDYFYIIRDGYFDVLKDGEAVARLSPGDAFGEDALISDVRRNATVQATTAGTLMRLSRQDFAELLRHPVVEWVTPGQAGALMEHGAEMIDVRMEGEYEQRRLKDADNAPLVRLRELIAGRDKTIPLVVYCDTGERSASAVFILNELGYDAYAIRGGLTSIRQRLRMSAS